MSTAMEMAPAMAITTYHQCQEKAAGVEWPEGGAWRDGLVIQVFFLIFIYYYYSKEVDRKQENHMREKLCDYFTNVPTGK